ncbi:MAG: hypothetical protein ACFFCS_13650 [Candidatus Hodarchaeota archaeon]
MFNYGILLDNEVLYASHPDYEQMLQIVNFSNSFAANIRDGRLFRIEHLVDADAYSTMIDSRDLQDDRVLMYVTTGTIDHLLIHDQKEILDKFVKEVEAQVNIKKVPKMNMEKIADFTLKVNRIAEKMNQELEVESNSNESPNMMDVKDNVVTKIHYLGISTKTGIPLMNMIYGESLIAHFKMPAKEDSSPSEMLRSLMSAQFSAIVKSSILKANTLITEITINHTDIETLQLNQLVIMFFPIGKNNQYTLEICYEGSHEHVNGFIRACFTMFSEHLQQEFKGNLQEMQPLRELMVSIPENFDLFGEPADLKNEEINEKLALDFKPAEVDNDNDDEWA